MTDAHKGMKNCFKKEAGVCLTYLCVYSFITYILSTSWKGFGKSYNIETHIKEAKKKKPTQNKDHIKETRKNIYV